MKRRGLVWLPAALGLAGVRAQGLDLERPPAPGAAPPLAWPAIDGFELGNGLRVVVAERHKVPLVTASLVLLAGRDTDAPGLDGRAALAATLLTKGARRGTRAMNAVQVAREAETLGASFTATTAWRHAALTMTVTPPRLGAALALLADAARAPLFAADEVERARAQALDGLRVDWANPAEVAQMAARRTFWGDVAPGRAPTAATLARLRADDLRRFHATAVRPDRAVLVLAGDLTPTQARTLAQAHFGGWARPSAPAAAVPSPAPSPIDAPGVLVDMPGSGQSAVVLAAPFVAGDARERAVADVANAVIGLGYSSRLNLEVRIKRGLSYGVFAFGEPQARSGAWFAVAQTQHATAGEVLRVMREEMERLARSAPEAAELDARRATLVGETVRRLETTAGLAQRVTAQVAAGREPAALARQVDELMAVTPEQVRAFAEATWGAARQRFAVAGDLAAAGSALADAAKGARRKALDGLDFGAAF